VLSSSLNGSFNIAREKLIAFGILHSQRKQFVTLTANVVVKTFFKKSDSLCSWKAIRAWSDEPTLDESAGALLR
jgi:hypothetical protein